VELVHWKDGVNSSAVNLPGGDGHDCQIDQRDYNSYTANLSLVESEGVIKAR